MPTTRITYDAGLPTGATTTALFDTTVAGPKDLITGSGSKYFVFSIANSETGTLNAYWSVDRGVTWHAHYTSGALAAPAAGSTNDGEVYIEHYADWKIEWVNGGVDQTSFEVSLALSDERSPVF